MREHPRSQGRDRPSHALRSAGDVSEPGSRHLALVRLFSRRESGIHRFPRPGTHAIRLGQRLSMARLYLKNDTVLPTGSLKDRSNSVGISKAKELGFAVATV